MTDLTKDEIVKMAREAGYRADAKMHDHDYDLFLNFYTLCRAPLVAEVERLEQWHAEMADNRNAIASERDTLKAELARVQAVAEWQGSADGGKSWRRIDKPRGESIESRVAYLRNMTNSQGRPIYLIRALYTTPKPAAQEPTSAVPVVEQLVGALSCNRIMAADSDGNYTKEVTPRIITAAIAAGQKFIKENGK